jgi:hypothetical protein
MCMVHKILQYKGGLKETWFEMAGDSVRSTRAGPGADPLTIRVRNGRLDMRRNFFSPRVTEDWNEIPAEVRRLRKCEIFRRTYKQLRADQLRNASWKEARADRTRARRNPEQMFPERPYLDHGG